MVRKNKTIIIKPTLIIIKHPNNNNKININKQQNKVKSDKKANIISS